ncbi:ribonuclease D [Agarilytica rhodophyticola]|uniref:ribonuclease D n=1 Tax=Agarilytica rhodophyticola TaxID=1737490 RepID=UPI000B3457C7|nr:ribonuclease D [Agarilytica rhodophyticola]
MSENLVKQPIIWVETNEHLEQICGHWQSKSMLAFDTEFMRSNTYYPIAGLIQVNDGEKNYLIDPTTIDDFYPLIDIIDNEDIVKVLHSCSEDLEVFHYAFGCLPNNIIDTQIAGAVLGLGYSVGYANLVRLVLNIDLPKSETRSNWLQRPLSQSQLHYAAIDVEYLFKLASYTIEQMASSKRLEWVQQDSRALVQNFFVNQDPDRSHLRFKSAWKLSPRQLASLIQLSRWREDLAQEKNVPRNRIVKESALFSLAQQVPTHVSQLKGYEGLNERMIRSNGSKIIKIVSAVKNIPEQELPARLPAPLTAEERALLDILKNKVAQIADQLNVPNELLAKKKDYEFLIHGLRRGDVQIPLSFAGWRRDIIGNALLEITKNQGN